MPLSPEDLQRVPLFSDLDRRELRSVASSLKERRISAGEALVSEGKGAIGFFLIGEGDAEVTIGGESRRTLHPGDYFGEIALIADSPRSATVTAKTDVVCYGLSSWEFRPLVEENSSIAWKLLQAMAKNYAQR